MSRLVKVRVKPGSRMPSVSSENDTIVVAVREPAQEGRANEAVRRALASFFDVAPSSVQLVHGAKGRLKTFSIGS